MTHAPPDIHPDRPAELPDRTVSERALDVVAANLVPAPFVLVPFVAAVGVVLDGSLARFAWWLVAAAGATVAVGGALVAHRRWTVTAPSRAARALGLGLGALGAVIGLGPWVVADGRYEVVLVLTLFAATAAALGCIATAGRLDQYFAYLVPLAGVSGVVLAGSSDDRLRSLGLLAVPFGVVLVVLHQVIGRGTIDAIRATVQAEQLVGQLDRERAVLTEVNGRLEVTNARLAHQATHDPLTGLYNRRGTLERLEHLLEVVSPQQPVSLLFCDLDRFKAVNDAIGHRGGDRFIAVIAERVAQSIGEGAIAGRIGGDEFVVVLPDHDHADAVVAARRIVDVVARPVVAEGREVPSSVSVGLAVAPHHGSTASDLLRHANAALYRAKAAGRNRVETFDAEMQRELVHRLEGEHLLRRALDDGEIVGYFQPEVDAVDGRIVGAELLARWERSDGSVVAAGELLPFAASAGLLERITEEVVASSRAHIGRFVALGLPEGFRFRINLAPSTTERRWGDDAIDRLLHGLDPRSITLDLAETAILDDLPAAAASLAGFRARGGKVCLDDFARGMSSLSLLRRLSVDEVRIDRLAIDALTSHPHDWAIARSIISLVRELGLVVTADGVQSGTQADALVALGCVRHQGHHYAPALPAAEFERFLVRWTDDHFLRRHVTDREWVPGEGD